MMAKDALTMHQNFVSEIRQRRQMIADEDRRLATVEQYHLDVIAQLLKAPPIMMQRRNTSCRMHACRFVP